MLHSDAMNRFDIHPVTAQNIRVFAEGLQRLSVTLNDPYLATPARLAAACLGPSAPCRGLIAQSADDLLGVAFVSPVFSTAYGSMGAFVSDLWVSDDARGMGLGRALLAAAARLGRDTWQAEYLKLTVYEENTTAAQFYDRLGFSTANRDRNRLLTGADYATLAESFG